jgi:hypothetical protein
MEETTMEMDRLYDAATIAAARAGRVTDDVALWRAAMHRACAAGRPHYLRYLDPTTGRLLAEVPACAHPAPGGSR